MSTIVKKKLHGYYSIQESIQSSNHFLCFVVVVQNINPPEGSVKVNCPPLVISYKYK